MLKLMTCPAVWAHIPGFFRGICFYGRSLHCFHDNVIRHSSRHPGMARARQGSPTSSCESGPMGPSPQYLELCLGSLHQCRLLYSYNLPSHPREHELDIVRALWHRSLLSLFLISTNTASSVVTVGIIAFLLINWVTNQKYVFKGPNINFEVLNANAHDFVEKQTETTTS